jgi:hypothetical protein
MRIDDFHNDLSLSLHHIRKPGELKNPIAWALSLELVTIASYNVTIQFLYKLYEFLML